MIALETVALDDATLVERVRRGDERAFATLYRRHARYVAGVLHKLLRNEQDLDDLMQQAFADSYLGVQKLREPSEFRAWVTRIAVRRAYDRLAARRRAQWLTQALTILAPRRSDPDGAEEIDTLYGLLDGISPALRIPWILHTLQGETHEAVADACGISLSTAKRRVIAAQTQLEKRQHAR
jgi:RNA polymerase sigma-70 factor, ECF subfamily